MGVFCITSKLIVFNKGLERGCDDCWDRGVVAGGVVIVLRWPRKRQRALIQPAEPDDETKVPTRAVFEVGYR